ncbi:unnamed protein product [Tetraodon nigroviridis]|uniref:(spotted green pufferfish) hypothetical protein n=1 Tax=Tetraodon nigroviridis TaxID=99883 RepID=Q4S5K8_TETNG|nr:unnamed protein product [Tetraodon nigroviridis]
MEDDDVCEYDSTWDTESDGDDPTEGSQSRRSCQDKNRSGWSLNVIAFAVTRTALINCRVCCLFLHTAGALLSALSLAGRLTVAVLQPC